MDFWIQASLHNLIKYVHEEMDAYRLYTVVPGLVRYIEQLTKEEQEQLFSKYEADFTMFGYSVITD